MDKVFLWSQIAQMAINYIVVSTISATNQKQTVTDVKTDLRTTKEDLMSATERMTDKRYSNKRNKENQ